MEQHNMFKQISVVAASTKIHNFNLYSNFRIIFSKQQRKCDSRSTLQLLWVKKKKPM